MTGVGLVSSFWHNVIHCSKNTPVNQPAGSPYYLLYTVMDRLSTVLQRWTVIVEKSYTLRPLILYHCYGCGKVKIYATIKETK